MEFVQNNEDLRGNLSAAAHLIHGSSEGRFRITYCPGKLTREEIEGVGYKYADLNEMLAEYDPDKLADGERGRRRADLLHPQSGLGLWAYRERMENR
jgi:hypothetical protein